MPNSDNIELALVKALLAFFESANSDSIELALARPC